MKMVSFLFKRAERIFSEVLDLERGSDERRRERGMGNLSIVTTLPYTFTNIIELFFNEYPTIKYQASSVIERKLEQFIENGKYDVCITTEKIEPSECRVGSIIQRRNFFNCTKIIQRSKLAQLILWNLRTLPFIGLTDEYSFRQFTDQFCQSVGYTPVYQVEVEEATTILQLVKNGRGAAFTPETSMNLYEDKIKHLKIENGKFTRTIGLLKHKYTYATAISKAFIQHCYDYFENTHKYTIKTNSPPIEHRRGHLNIRGELIVLSNNVL